MKARVVSLWSVLCQLSKKETFLPEFSNYIANSSSVAWEKRETRVFIGRKLRGDNETMDEKKR